jgi:hypothetical protein
VTAFKIALVSFEILEKVGTTPALPENKKGKKSIENIWLLKSGSLEAFALEEIFRELVRFWISSRLSIKSSANLEFSECLSKTPKDR